MFLVTILRQLNQLACRECISFKKEQILSAILNSHKKIFATFAIKRSFVLLKSNHLHCTEEGKKPKTAVPNCNE